MPRSLLEEEARREDLVWILIAVFEPVGSFDKPSFHAVARAYVGMLEARGFTDLMIFFDIVTEISRSIEDALGSALQVGLLGWEDMHKGRYPVNTDERQVRHFLAKSNCLSLEEIDIAFTAAHEAFQMFRDRKIRPKFQIYQT
jgi:hypothetical protein